MYTNLFARKNEFVHLIECKNYKIAKEIFDARSNLFKDR